MPGKITVTEETDKNLLEYFYAIPAMSDTGTTLSVTTPYQVIAENGDITYVDHEYTAQVTVHINKSGGNEDTKDVLVIIPAHTTIFSNGILWYVVIGLSLAALIIGTVLFIIKKGSRKSGNIRNR